MSWFWKRKNTATQMHAIIHRAEEVQSYIATERPGILERAERLESRRRVNHIGPALRVAMQRRGA